MLGIELSPITSPPYFDTNRLLRDQHLITDIRFEHDNTELTIELQLATGQVQVYPDLYAEPTRLVIDLYPTADVLQRASSAPVSVTADSLQSTATLDVQNADSVAPHAAVPEDSAETNRYETFLSGEPTSSQEKLLSHEAPTQNAHNGAKPDDKEDKKIATVVLIIAAFILIDAVMFTMLFLNRKKKKKPAAKEASTELPKPVDFAAILNSMAGGASVVSNPVRTLSFIDAERVPHDFEAMQLSTNIPKEYWLGQDGMRLLERLRGDTNITGSKNFQPPMSN